MAICSVVANALLAYALAHGLVISFWRTALRGHTLAELNQNWLCGHSLQHALIGGFRVGGRITALACILSVVSLLRGPLNQRASHIESNILYNTSGTIPITVAQQLTEGYTGIARDSRAPIMEISRLTPDFAQVMQEYSERSNISIDTQDGSCGDSCTAFVKVLGPSGQKPVLKYSNSKLI
ncbi:hypothetical protein P153DRAFT_206499 [Dothidotthia symphoricarpi CBS 119687]|uniref:Uncharacterized protein n=1 Tax=Dothidotthia symphoricarpi CBS 119687 TaxID=1392245 RepID=A0A6A6AJ24_9PLEO|nr:uncharacterized protein P153DRAFT_206499 [Dothidotthia symphoricarpi CBS 119687]KAF2130904.1 hypothetical protein P153DRAFT_206499 [Dothidotthia symphoricarpi CBS 119687]